MMEKIEILGFIATSIILVSFLFSDTKKIRSINAVGCILFVIYGVMISATSVWVLNAVCFGIQIFKIIKESKLQTGQKSGDCNNSDNNL